MKTVIQRVKSASVTVDGQLISTISKGLLVFAAIGKDDEIKETEKMARDVLKAKLWDDGNGSKWKKNVVDIQGEVLCVSQFTLLATTKKGSPSFHRSAAPTKGKELYDHFISNVRSAYQPERVKDGVFQAMMDVSLVNDGPVGVDYCSQDEAVTIEIETKPPKMDNPTAFEAPEGSDTTTFTGKLQKKFELPASLLE